jgi:hypothetical protein
MSPPPPRPPPGTPRSSAHAAPSPAARPSHDIAQPFVQPTNPQPPDGLLASAEGRQPPQPWHRRPQAAQHCADLSIGRAGAPTWPEVTRQSRLHRGCPPHSLLVHRRPQLKRHRQFERLQLPHHAWAVRKPNPSGLTRGAAPRKMRSRLGSCGAEARPPTLPAGRRHATRQLPAAGSPPQQRPRPTGGGG